MIDKKFYLIFEREIKSFFNGPTTLWFSLAFFLLCILLFPLGIGTNEKILSDVSAGIIWVSALFSNLLSLDRLYKEDYEDGTLHLYYVSNMSIISMVLAKCLSHWILTGIPIVILSPIIAKFIYMDENSANILFYSLILGTPLLTLIGSPLSALTLGLTVRGPILAFISLPFMIPVLIFGVSAVNASVNNIDAFSELYFLAGMISIGVFLSPLVTKYALRVSME